MSDPIRELAEEIAEECMKAYNEGVADGCRLAIKTMNACLEAGGTHEQAIIIFTDIVKEKFGD